jgi:hypothetical protein
MALCFEIKLRHILPELEIYSQFYENGVLQLCLQLFQKVSIAVTQIQTFFPR